MGKMDILKKYRYPFCLGGLFVIAFLLRAYRIGELPDVLHTDEAGIGYNAWCLANFGVDRYLNEFPIYLQNYDAGQSPLYTYCLVLLFKLFPGAKMTLELIRIPALFSSMLAVICMAKMLGMIFANKKITIAGTALMTFCPYFIMSGRYALDCNMMLGISILAITLLIQYLQKPTWSSLLWCGGGFALVLYTYALSCIVLFIFLVVFSLYMLYTKKINIGRLLIFALEICVLGLPIILFVICLVFKLPGFRFLGIHILPIASGRVKELAATGFWDNFFDCIKITLTRDFYIFDAVDKFYTMYVISIPFIVVGFVWALTDFVKALLHRCFVFSAIFVLYAIAVLVTIGFANSGVIYRANAIFVCYVYFCIVGIRVTLHFLHRYRRAFGIAVCICYMIWTAVFIRYYFGVYSVAYAHPYPYFQFLYFIPDREALAYVIERQDVDRMYIDGLNEEYLYFYYPCSPYEKENADPTGAERELCMEVDYYTPLESATIYMVRKENREFITKIQNAGMPYETREYTYYYVFMIP